MPLALKVKVVLRFPSVRPGVISMPGPLFRTSTHAKVSFIAPSSSMTSSVTV